MRDLLILMLAMSLLPLGVIYYSKRKTGHKMAAWKIVLCIFLFEVSFVPYALSLFSLRTSMGWLNLTYFLLIWTSFYISRFILPSKFSIVAPILFGLMLIEPASSFITISDSHIYFGHGNGQTSDLSRGGNKVLDFMHDLYKIAWAVLPLIGTHYLLKSIEKDIEKDQEYVPRQTTNKR